MNLLRSPIALSLISGALLCIAWPAIGGLWPLIFIAFIPMLMMEDRLYSERKTRGSRGIFGIAFLGFLLWNIGTTYFILYIREPDATAMQEFIARLVGGGLTYVLNACFMAIVWWLFHRTRRSLGGSAGYASLILYWLSFEYVHMHWSINWPWLNLGQVFAEQTWAVQWYEYTGVPGGTLWVLLANILLFHLFKAATAKQPLRISTAIISSGVIAIPLLLSIYIGKTTVAQGEEVEVVCVQPNLDPYSEKFVIDPIIQLRDMINLMDSADSEATRFYLLPETALQEPARIHGSPGAVDYTGLWEHTYNKSMSAQLIKNFLAGKDAVVVAGAADRAIYEEQATITARHIPSLDVYYDSFNSTLLIGEDGVEEEYRKSKLVPGVESIPFVSVLAFLDDLALDLGGASGSLGSQEEAEVFAYEGMKVAPTICYESIFGDYNTDFVRQGAQAIFISTNDSWWQDSPGYRHLLHYARLRAIETRRDIARSANTGITCFIDQHGQVTSSLGWCEEGALRGSIRLNDELTFYVKHGDYLSRVAALFSVLLLLWSLVRPLKARMGT